MARGRRQTQGTRAAVPQLDYTGFAVRWGLLYENDGDRVEPDGDPELGLGGELFDLHMDSESFCELILEVGRSLPADRSSTSSRTRRRSG